MEKSKADYTMTFFQLGNLTEEQLLDATLIPVKLWALKALRKQKYFSKWLKLYHDRLQLNPKHVDHRAIMKSQNPR